MSLENFLDISNLIALPIILIGGLVRGYTGFGSGLVMVPLLAILWSPVDAIVVVLSMGVISTIQMAYPAARLTNWKDTLPIILAGIFISPIGTYFLVTLDPEIVKKVIAGIVFFFTLISLIGWSYRGPRGIIPSFLAGSLAAIINGIAAVGGPAFVLYIMSLPEKPAVQRANLAIITSTMGTSVLTYTIIAGNLDERNFERIILFILPSALAVWCGTRLFRIVPGERFKTIILIFLLVVVSIILLT